MRRMTFILFMCAALLVGGAAFAAPGEAEIIISDGRLSVTAQNAIIGNVLSVISQQAGFELDINPEVSRKTVTTKFTDLDIQKGIERLLSLIRQKDYFIYYNPDGGIRRLEVHGPSDTSGSSAQRPRTLSPADTRRNNRRRTPTRPQIRQTPQKPNSRHTSPAARPPSRQRTPVQQPGTAIPPMPVNPKSVYPPGPPDFPVESMPEGMMPPPPSMPDDMGSTPYIPPARMPAYIPPKN